MERIWVAELSISTRVSNKINNDHSISDDEVRDAVVCVADLYGHWDEHSTFGLRALLDITIRDRPVTVVLYPREHPMGDAWGLGSVYFVD